MNQFSRTFFLRFDLNDVLEREWWLMRQLKQGYNDIENMPWEYVEWFYNRQTQYLINLEKAKQEAQNKFI